MSNGTGGEPGTTHVTMEGPGVSVTRDVTDEQAAAILSIILRPAGAAGHRGQGGVSTRETVGGGPGSLGEFFRNVAPRRNPDKIVTIAHYMKAVEGKGSFLAEEVLARFIDVGEPAPGNFNRDFRWAKGNAWIALDAKTGEYYVTASGSEAVDTGFSEDVKKTTKIKPGRRARRRAGMPEPSEA